MSPRLWLRWFAVAIAAAGIVDPPVRSTRTVRPEVAIVDTGHAALAQRVTDVLAGDFDVIRGPFIGAAATVLAGPALPPEAAILAGPGFIVVPDRVPAVEIVAVDAPGRVFPDGRVPVTVAVRARSGTGAVTVILEQDGVATDRVARELDATGRPETMVLWFVPTTAGAATPRIRAVRDTSAAHVDLAIDVRPARWRTLFFDTRPSWMSTFVRRALELDPRFSVVTRVVTSRDVSVDVGGAPSGLSQLADLRPFDVVVVGAAEALSPVEVAGLEAFARRRGGTVVLLLTAPVQGAYEQWLGVAGWRERTTPGPVAIRPVSAFAETLPATELAWPAALPALAEPLAVHAAGGGLADVPIVWSLPVGAGQVIVSGALDAWRYRSAAEGGFDPFWREVVAAAAARAMASVEIVPRSLLLEPGETAEFSVSLREVALGAEAGVRTVGATVAGTLENDFDGMGAPTPVRIWPDGAPGALRAAVTAPETPGTYRLVVRSGDDEGDATLVVSDTATRLPADDGASLDDWASSRGGRVMEERDLDTLAASLHGVIGVSVSESDWHPMRTPWWLLPFALSLTLEWWSRRRRGQA